MFNKYYDLIYNTFNKLGSSSNDISLASYLSVVFNSIVIIAYHVFTLLAIVIAMSIFPHILYNVIIERVIYNKNKDINIELSSLIEDYEEAEDEFYRENPDEVKVTMSLSQERKEFIDDTKSIMLELRELVDKKDKGIIWKAYLFSFPLLLIYIAAIIPLMLIVVDLLFPWIGSFITTLLIIAYTLRLIWLAVKSFNDKYYRETSLFYFEKKID